MAATAKPEIKAFFDEPTNTVSYLVWDPATKAAAVVDPVLDFDHKSGEANVKAADALLAEAARLGLKIGRVLETHVHADHLSAAPYIKQKTGAPVCIGEHIRDVQQIFRPVFNASDVSGEGSEFDHLFKDGEHFSVGTIDAEVMYTPGHTPACVSYRIGDAVFVGDTMFMPDYGTARADFPGGDAHQLYRSIRRILGLPGKTRLFMCHDYKAPGRDQYAWETTVAEEKTRNVHVHEGIGEDEFVAKRNARDKTLSTPLLLLPSIQVNMRAGHFPPAEANGVRYLKVPLKLGA
ncbi:MAG TPA: MBL fold metallo-hydrolase [Pseudolabrys sp.]|jgi:glyoxylase-like metal-dependent hydrolase (beta-lactamase superfamily II)|uniref:MBL fold metallo-hydrolase n=1 Tax=Pseudolabrys sp. TaxID=1960880 RepID=UPI002DDCEF35|nr:MBL fold metallo-hydrolase [Pseudolabrys sp.]HEV2628278.1 MBL fold metallo-hydrolase [Pseudolabrys sp.]